MRTPGQEALREAARLESAKVYGRTCPEHRPTEPAQPVVAVTPPPQPRRLRAVS